MDFLQPLRCDDAFEEAEGATGQIQIVHLWLKQRTGRKYFTEVEGLAEDLNWQKIMKFWRHQFHCDVSRIVNKDEKGKIVKKIIRLQGDQRNLVLNFLIEEKIISKENIKTHGF
jgi:translation initiation factor 1